MYSESVDFYHCFMYILSILASIFVIFSHTFHVQFCSQIFNRFLVQKRCPKWTQNHPKIDPSASQGGVWLPGFIRSSLDMPFLRFLMPKWLPKCAKNDPIEPPMVPRTIKISHFPPNGRSGIVLLGVSGRIPSHLLLMVQFFPKLFRRIGVGRGGEEAHFSRSHHSASKPSFSTTTSDWHGAALLCNLDIHTRN